MTRGRGPEPNVLLSSRGRRFLPVVLVLSVGLSLGLTACGSSGPSKSYQQGWDRSVRSAGTDDCDAVPSGTKSGSDWTKGCNLGKAAMNLHESGHPAAAPTTFPGDP
jgi:hypothetical protein